MPHRFIIFLALLFLAACHSQKKIGRLARQSVLSDSALQRAHVGISIFEPATGTYWYRHQADRYFVPASNTKIPTLYAALKFLGDSLVGLRFSKVHDSLYLIQPAGDPSFLQPEFSRQPVLDFFRSVPPTTRFGFAWKEVWEEKGLGPGWAWDDYQQPYMAERSPFPIQGNLVRFKLDGDQNHLPEDVWVRDSLLPGNKYRLERPMGSNKFYALPSSRDFDSATLTLTALSRFDEFRRWAMPVLSNKLGISFQGRLDTAGTRPETRWTAVHSQPVDSLLKPMMHHSDNFYAEQSLLMASHELLGVMNSRKIIDTLLKSDFKDLPHKPRWVDGSGLSRYNLFTPNDLVAILDKMQKAFGMERLKVLFPTGNMGTLQTYYTSSAGYIFAKTGTLSGVLALSGYLYTRKNRLLIFSVLINNHNASAPEIRRVVERFIQGLRETH